MLEIWFFSCLIFFYPLFSKIRAFFFAHLVTVQNGCLRGVILFNLVFGIVFFFLKFFSQLVSRFFF
jgi:hypothetical protein